jgi:hypothetical protein
MFPLKIYVFIVVLKKVDTKGVKKLYLCESVGVPPERRA